MTQREKELFRLIEADPSISQNEIAKRLGIARSSVAVHITNLMKKGFILGKGYILSQEPYVLVIGGSNMDIQGFPSAELKLHDSNIGTIKLSHGGVARNIAENAARLGLNTKLITVLGDDIYGKSILDHALEISLNMKDSLIDLKGSTSTYLSILEANNDMHVAINAMDSIHALDLKFIERKKQVIQKASLLILDTNLDQNVIEKCVEYANCPVFIDTVSTSKALKIQHILNKIDTLKPNRMEAEVLSGIKIESLDDVKKAAKVLLDKGVKNVFISLSEEGVYALNQHEDLFLPNPKVTVKNTTGAGDAMMACLAYARFNNLNVHEGLRLAISASALCVQDENTITQDLNIERIYSAREEYFK
jgi:pseudouridine kinase